MRNYFAFTIAAFLLITQVSYANEASADKKLAITCTSTRSNTITFYHLEKQNELSEEKYEIILFPQKNRMTIPLRKKDYVVKSRFERGETYISVDPNKDNSNPFILKFEIKLLKNNVRPSLITLELSKDPSDLSMLGLEDNDIKKIETKNIPSIYECVVSRSF